MPGDDILSAPPVAADQRLRYGPEPEQFADLLFRPGQIAGAAGHQHPRWILARPLRPGPRQPVLRRAGRPRHQHRQSRIPPRRFLCGPGLRPGSRAGRAPSRTCAAPTATSCKTPPGWGFVPRPPSFSAIPPEASWRSASPLTKSRSATVSRWPACSTCAAPGSFTSATTPSSNTSAARPSRCRNTIAKPHRWS